MWNGKRPPLKLKTLERDRTQGGLALPNFKMYFWSFVLRPLSVWFSPNASVSWRPIEENLSQPHRLQDLVYSNIPSKKANKCLGPLISFLLRTCCSVMKHAGVDLNWHNHSPIFNNFSLIIGNTPLSFPQWSGKEVHVLRDLYDEDGFQGF